MHVKSKRKRNNQRGSFLFIHEKFAVTKRFYFQTFSRQVTKPLRRNKRNLIIFYKNHPWSYTHISHRSRPPLTQETTDYNLRNANDIRTLHANTNLNFNSLLSSTIRARLYPLHLTETLTNHQYTTMQARVKVKYYD